VKSCIRLLVRLLLGIGRGALPARPGNGAATARPKPVGPRRWEDVEVTPPLLGAIIAFIAMTSVVVVGAVEVFNRWGVGYIPAVVGTSGQAFAIFALARLYSVFLRQQGVRATSGAARFLLTPYGQLILAFAFVMALALVSLGLLTLDAYLGLHLG
jgi:hypothetical protein